MGGRPRAARARAALLAALLAVLLSTAAPARAQRAGPWNPFGGGGSGGNGGGPWRGIGGGVGRWRGGGNNDWSNNNNNNNNNNVDWNDQGGNGGNGGVIIEDDAFGDNAAGGDAMTPGPDVGGSSAFDDAATATATGAPVVVLPPPPQASSSSIRAPAPPVAPSPSPKPPPKPAPGGSSNEAEALLKAASQPVGTTFLSASSLAGGNTGAAQAGAGLATDAVAAAVDNFVGGFPPGGTNLVGFAPPPAAPPPGRASFPPPGGDDGNFLTTPQPVGITPRGAAPTASSPGSGPMLVPDSCSDLWDCIQRAPALQLLRRWVEVAQFRDALPKCSGSSVTLAGKQIGAATLFATADSWFYGYNCAGLDFTPLFPVPFGTESDGKVYAARNFVLGGLIPGTRVAFNWNERDRPKSVKTYAGYAMSYKITSSGDKLVEWTTGLGVPFQARVLATVSPSGCGGKVVLHVVSKPVAPPSSFETQLASGGDALGAGKPPDAAKLGSLSAAVAAEPSTRLYFGQLAATGQLDSLPKCAPGGRVAYGGRTSAGATIFVPRDAFFYGVSCWALNFAPLQRLFRDNAAARAFAQANFVTSGIVADQALRPSAFTGSPKRVGTASGGSVAVFKDGSTGALKVAWENARPGAVREARVLRTIVPGGCPNTVMHVVDVAVAPKGALAGRRRRRVE